MDRGTCAPSPGTRRRRPTGAPAATRRSRPVSRTSSRGGPVRRDTGGTGTGRAGRPGRAGGRVAEIRANTVLPARRTPVTLHTADGLTLVGELAVPEEREPVATVVLLHPLPTQGGMMDS